MKVPLYLDGGGERLLSLEGPGVQSKLQQVHKLIAITYTFERDVLQVKY